MSKDETTVLSMIRQTLQAMHADGLSNRDIECGCLLDDLAPCGCPQLNNCVAGMRVADDEDEQGWIVVPLTSNH